MRNTQKAQKPGKSDESLAPLPTESWRTENLPVELEDQSLVSEEIALKRPLSEIVKATLDSAASRSRHTARAYQTAIGLFLQHLDAERGGILPAERQSWRPFAEAYELEKKEKLWKYRGPAAVLRLVTPSLLGSFKAWRERSGDSPNTIGQRLPAVRTFLSIAYRDGILTHQQASGLGIRIYQLKTRKDVKPVGRRLASDEVLALRTAPNLDLPKGTRDLAILDCMLYLGLRAEEVCFLHLNEFKVDGGRWWVNVKGKGRKTRRIRVHDDLLTSLNRWLQLREKQLGEGSERLFTGVFKSGTVRETPIDPTLISRLVCSYGFRAGLAPESGSNILSPHDLRRTCARNSYDNGASLLLVQKLLGHSDPKTTAHYIGAFEDDSHTAIDFVRYSKAEVLL